MSENTLEFTTDMVVGDATTDNSYALNISGGTVELEINFLLICCMFCIKDHVSPYSSIGRAIDL